MGLFDVFTGTKRPASGTTPQPQHEVHNALLALNRPDAPFLIRDGSPENADLVCEWRILDPEWYAYFEAVGLSRTYQIYMRFNATKNQVRAVDKTWTVRWAAGIPALAPTKEVNRGQVTKKETVLTFEKDENGKRRLAKENTFSSSDLKEPLRNAVTGLGWTWRGVSMGKL